jgi:hypothetical protein
MRPGNGLVKVSPGHVTTNPMVSECLADFKLGSTPYIQTESENEAYALEVVREEGVERGVLYTLSAAAGQKITDGPYHSTHRSSTHARQHRNTE